MLTMSLVRTVIISRIAVVVTQFIANHVIKDHDAGVFLSPKSGKTESFFDVFVQEALGGFLRWDAHYFTHVAKYGYTYENTLAFFPLYPTLISLFARLLQYAFPFCNIDSLVLLIGVLLNFFFSTLATLSLYELSKLVLVKEETALKAALLFCFNPATIFFSAPYSEALFAHLTFSGMLNILGLYKRYLHSNKSVGCRDILYIIPIAMSTCTRSNGLLNIGFLAYFFISFYYHKLRKCKHNLLHFTLKVFIVLVFSVCFCTIPFITYQMYAYNLFCKDFNASFPANIHANAVENNLVLQGTFLQHNQTWCHQQFPFSYSYIQNHYWNVGFLRYFEVKQIPNFALAFPVTYLVFRCSYEFFRYYPTIFFKPFFSDERSEKFLPKGAFVFIAHALFLAVFNFLCIHVQVSTRILCSASPVLYWYCAFILKNVPMSEFFKFRKSLVRLNTLQMFVKYYFVSYFFVGIVLFCNFLPWT